MLILGLSITLYVFIFVLCRFRWCAHRLLLFWALSHITFNYIATCAFSIYNIKNKRFFFIELHITKSITYLHLTVIPFNSFPLFDLCSRCWMANSERFIMRHGFTMDCIERHFNLFDSLMLWFCWHAQIEISNWTTFFFNGFIFQHCTF